jgi:flagellar biosynthesis protein FliP
VHLLAAGVLLTRPSLLTVLASIGVVVYALVLLRPVLAARTTPGNGVVKVGV